MSVTESVAQSSRGCPPGAGPAREAAVLLLSGILAFTAGCTAALEAEEVTPELRALEIIVAADESGSVACSLNYDEVGAGTHPVSVIAEQDSGHVRILDQAEAVVFEVDAVAGAGAVPDGAEDQPDMIAEDQGGNEGGNVRLVPGEYWVECSRGRSVSTASLHVIPASGPTED